MAAPATVGDGPDRLRIDVLGAVQGVGFRPFVHRLAEATGLVGCVRNQSGGVQIEVEGDASRMRAFLRRLESEAPVGSRIDGVETTVEVALGVTAFRIAASGDHGIAGPVPLDAAPCDDCLAEIFRRGDRRYRYPFVSCSACGPRHSIVEGLPYDRARTSMRGYPMCATCEDEYRSPSNRRFHAQTNCCFSCGPRLALWDTAGRSLARDEEALARAARAVSEGAILALKGLGGFQLVADATDSDVVERLRVRKGRPDKPFAVLVPDLARAEALCRVSALEASVLCSRAAPIVLLERVTGGESSVVDCVAPGNPDLGVMLPATPLHHLFLDELGRPVVATSGNRSGQPICHLESDAASELEGLADLFLVHDRPITHPVDDSVVRVVRGRERVFRAGRGYAPLEVPVAGARSGAVAWGGLLKNTVAVSTSGRVRVSSHIGDLRSPGSRALAARTVAWLAGLDDHGSMPRHAVDLHPGASRAGTGEVQVQHHFAHVLACMAEHEVLGPVLGVAWDGNGYGPDGTIWGGEFLVCDRRGFRRAAHLRTFPLPGAQRAILEGRRAALGLLYELDGARALHDHLDLAPVRSFDTSERRTMTKVLQREINCPRTSSMGRLFDALASLTDLRQKTTFEGQAAMALEFVARGYARADAYPFPVCERGEGQPLVADWEPLVRAVLRDVRLGSAPDRISARFHGSLVELILEVAQRVGIGQVVLTGGCFQNQMLLERAVDRLEAAGFEPLSHRRVPPNDGGLALGQMLHASTEPLVEG